MVLISLWNVFCAAFSNTKRGLAPSRLDSSAGSPLTLPFVSHGYFFEHPISPSPRECWAACLVGIPMATPFFLHVKCCRSLSSPLGLFLCSCSCVFGSSNRP